MDELERIREKKLREMEERFFGSDNERSDYPSAPIVVSDSNFDGTLGKYPQVVVDCWAAWCAPCNMIAPVIEELARDYAGKIVFGKLDVDENPGTARKYMIMSIPALLVFKHGRLVDQIIGAMPRNMLEPKIKKLLGG
jgi:thioredoxin 1